MNSLQKSFEKTIKETFNPKTILKKLISNKFESLGIKLKETKITQIVDEMELIENDSFDLNIEESDIIHSTSEVDLQALNIILNESDINEVSDKMLSVIPQIYQDSAEDVANHLLKSLRKKLPNIIKENVKERKNFEREILNLWKKPLTLLEFFICLVVDLGTNFNIYYNKSKKNKKDLVFEVLLGLYARACLVSTEILVLLKAGFSDGSHARWRTLHEIAVVAMFIDKHGKEVAERYLLHEYVEDYKGAMQHQKYCEITKNIPLTKRELNKIVKKYQNVVNKFGNDFKSEYGWASEALNMKRPTFSDIEKDINLDAWRPDYKLASHNVHANPMGISVKLGRLPKDSQSLLIGASMVGLDEAGQATAMTLLKIITTLMSRETNLDILVSWLVLMKLEKEITSEFINIANEIESI